MFCLRSIQVSALSTLQKMRCMLVALVHVAGIEFLNIVGTIAVIAGSSRVGLAVAATVTGRVMAEAQDMAVDLDTQGMVVVAITS
jgi:hypothetical protein